ncbi:hypothetical protein SALBM311S_11341 [Streptomyces alboniger]
MDLLLGRLGPVCAHRVQSTRPAGLRSRGRGSRRGRPAGGLPPPSADDRDRVLGGLSAAGPRNLRCQRQPVRGPAGRGDRRSGRHRQDVPAAAHRPGVAAQGRKTLQRPDPGRAHHRPARPREQTQLDMGDRFLPCSDTRAQERGGSPSAAPHPRPVPARAHRHERKQTRLLLVDDIQRVSPPNSARSCTTSTTCAPGWASPPSSAALARPTSSMPPAKAATAATRRCGPPTSGCSRGPPPPT